MKRDGHTHSHFCNHASGEETEALIQRAIQLGFTMYSITEHMPLPESWLARSPYTEEWKESLRIRGNDFDAYIREMQKLKHKYADRIQILVGSEIDYLPDQLDYTRAVLREYGPYFEDSLLSVHHLQGKDGWRAVDHDPEDFQDGLIDFYGSYENVQLEYYRVLKESMMIGMGPYKPKRISHLTLANKFQCFFKMDIPPQKHLQEVILDILQYMKEHGFSIDVNTAGLYREHCREVYPSPWIIKRARQLGIPMIYGSDSHAVADVGRAYAEYEILCVK